MGSKSDIQWTDATWNPVRGCVKVSPGCANCYAETFAERFRGVPGHAYEQGFDVRLVPELLDAPLRWTKPRRIFVNSMSDLFQDGVSDSYIMDVFGVMARAQRHTFQVLTKRAERMRDAVSRLGGQHWTDTPAWPLPNVWLGVSVENQHFADERISLLLQTPAAVRFISAEPLLGPVDLHLPVLEADSDGYLDWVIVGGESGNGARMFNVDWARDIVRQCKAAGVSVFVKQLGARPVLGQREKAEDHLVHRLMLRSRKGGDMAEWPADLQVREFPA